MANIKNILGTDSISASRIVINDNFEALNVDLNALQSLLNTTNETLTIGGLATVNSLDVSSVLTANTSNGIKCLVSTEFSNEVKLKAVKHNVSAAVTTLPNANSFEYSIYLVNSGSGALITEALHNGDEGQEIMLVANGGSDGFTITPDAANINEVTTSIPLDGNDFVFLRFVNGLWHVINHSDGVIIS